MLGRIILLGLAGAIGYWQRDRLKNALSRRKQPRSHNGPPPPEPDRRAEVVYQVVEHDGGFAYKVDGVFSETFPTREAAQLAAEDVARRHAMPGSGGDIEYQDSGGAWHHEVTSGEDRPAAEVRPS